MHQADIIWQKDAKGREIPIDARTGDVYFSQEDGLFESEYVFIHANHLPSRFNAIKAHDCFSIGELGFGTGLNFLLTMAYFIRHAPKARLYFLSCEKYPLAHQDFIRAVQIWQDHPFWQALLGEKISTWRSHVNALYKHYPPNIVGTHRLEFSNITLDLYIGDGIDWLDGEWRVDAWFVDGFAPKYGGALWSDTVFYKMHARSRPATTFATFSAAGFVRRGLTDAGFTVKKRQGFGKKREMLAGQFCLSNTIFTPLNPTTKTHNVRVLGAGVAGLCVAWALAQRGVHVQIFDVKPLSGASGNPVALATPKFAKNSTFGQISFLYARQFFHKLCVAKNISLQEYAPVRHAIAPLHDGNSTSAVLINPHAFAQKVLAHPNIVFCAQKLQAIDDKIVTVVATAKDAPALLHFPPCRHIRGQVSFAPYRGKAFAKRLAKNYCIGAFGAQLVGASTVRDDNNTDLRTQEHDEYVHATQAPTNADWQMRASVRAQLPNYHPVCGQVQANIYAFYGLGSRGFSIAPLLAEHLADSIVGAPSPLPWSLCQKISPNRDVTLR